LALLFASMPYFDARQSGWRMLYRAPFQPVLCWRTYLKAPAVENAHDSRPGYVLLCRGSSASNGSTRNWRRLLMGRT